MFIRGRPTLLHNAYLMLENYKAMLRINMKHSLVSLPWTQLSTKVPTWGAWMIFVETISGQPPNERLSMGCSCAKRRRIKASLTELCIRVRMIQSIFSVCACKNRMQCSRWEWDHRNRYVSSIINLIRPSSAPALLQLLCIGLKCRVWQIVRTLSL